MRKHDVRKWLHAVLDLLPVILIPVFMIYSHRHTIDSGSIQVPQNQVVDFNQLQHQPTSISDFYTNDATLTFDYENSYFVANLNGGNIVTYPIRLINLNPEHIYFGSVNIKASSTSVQLYEFYHTYPVTNINVFDRVSFTFQNKTDLSFTLRDTGTTFEPVYFNSFMCVDLTQMFGKGNEPTIEQFNQWYPNDYYDYTLSHKELLKGTSTITYDDTDIMSQVVYQLYNSVDKYFNMGNVFNMTGVYDWFNVNIFNGNAPISIYIVWNIVLYEFVMDLLFLLYGLFMWFIDMVEKLMEKPLKSVK